MKSMITKKMISIVTVIMFIILTFIAFIQIFNYQNNMDAETYTLFEQVEQILAQNTEEKEQTINDYNQLCLNYADCVAYILKENPAIMDDIDELKKIAGFMQIDEIHIFDQTGTIIKGTEPNYYGFTVYDGEQIGFFAQMLEDKSLRLCQEITPNTAESKEMQYAAVWSEDGEFIVQVGITPYRVFEVIRKNQLSYIFSLLTTENGADLYAIDIDTEEILGSTDIYMTGKTLADLGMSRGQIKDQDRGFHVQMAGGLYYCVATVYDSVLLLRACHTHFLYKNLLTDILLTAVCLAAIAIFMLFITMRYLNKYIIQGIYDINRKLILITDGKLDEIVDVSTTPEFKELSNHINAMIKSILLTTEKMSYVLDHAMLAMGVYEYNFNKQSVHTTRQVKNILCLDDKEADELFSDFNLFRAYLEKLKENPVDNYENTYKVAVDKNRYVRIESFEKDNNFLGILIDLTTSVLQNRKLENERDLDTLTGLYNRRGLENRLDDLFNHRETLKHSALIMLDADGLKQINDIHGHKAGDKYLCKIASLLDSIHPPKSIIARQGGDEYVLFYYDCDTEEELMQYILELSKKRDTEKLYINENHSVPVRYSFGYSLCYGRNDSYSAFIREADQKMYEEKKGRKKALSSPSR